MKSELYIELHDKKIPYSQLMDKVKDIWKTNGNLMKDLKTVELYLKPEEQNCYYVINDHEKGHWEI